MRVKIIIDVENEAELKSVSAALANIHEVSADTTPTKQTEVVTCTLDKAPIENGYDRKALEAEANELDVPFRSNISDKSLSIKIESYKSNSSKCDTKDSIVEAIAHNPEEEKRDEEELRQKISEARDAKETENPEEESNEPEEDEETQEPEEAEEEPEEEEVKDGANLKSALKSKRGNTSAIKAKGRKIKKVNWE